MSFLSAIFGLTSHTLSQPAIYESRYGYELPVHGVVIFAPKKDITAYELSLVVAQCRLGLLGGLMQLYSPLDPRIARHFEPVDKKTQAYLKLQREKENDL